MKTVGIKDWLAVILIFGVIFTLCPNPAWAVSAEAIASPGGAPTGNPTIIVSPQDLNAIIQTQKLALQAINTGDFSKIAPYLPPSFTLTAVDNQIFHSAKEFEAYWRQQLSGPIKQITLELKGDPTRNFLTPEIEVAYGAANATVNFADGYVGQMPMRWSAVLQKLQNKWMIQSLHFSVSLLDNPVLAAAQKLNGVTGIGAGAVGLILGALGMGFWRTKSKRSTLRS
jgi:hypothetical protein